MTLTILKLNFKWKFVIFLIIFRRKIWITFFWLVESWKFFQILHPRAILHLSTNFHQNRSSNEEAIQLFTVPFSGPFFFGENFKFLITLPFLRVKLKFLHHNTRNRMYFHYFQTAQFYLVWLKSYSMSKLKMGPFST